MVDNYVIHVVIEKVGLKQHFLALATYTKLIVRHTTVEGVRGCVRKLIGSSELLR